MKKINLDDADAGRVVLARNPRGVVAGLDRRDEGRFKVVTRLQPGTLTNVGEELGTAVDLFPAAADA